MPKLYLDDYKKKNKDKIIGICKSVDNEDYNNKFVYVSENRKEDGKQFIEVPDDVIISITPNTDPNVREIIYAGGCSGSGKSYMAKNYANAYQTLYPDRPVYLISKLESDETIDSMKIPPIRIPLDEIAMFDINNLSNSLIIFDDYDTLQAPYDKQVLNLIEDIAIMGRKHNETQGNVSMICLSHMMSNYKKTRIILIESTYICIYPDATTYHALEYFLLHYIGVDKKQLKQIRKIKSRALMFHNRYPKYVLYQTGVRLLDDFESE